MKTEKLYKMQFSIVYPLYIAKAERKNRTKADVDYLIEWLTGYTKSMLADESILTRSLEDFFSLAPTLNPNRKKITGVICGVRVEDIKEPLMQEIRYLDKLIDELAKGKKLESIVKQR